MLHSKNYFDVLLGEVCRRLLSKLPVVPLNELNLEVVRQVTKFLGKQMQLQHRHRPFLFQLQSRHRVLQNQSVLLGGDIQLVDLADTGYKTLLAFVCGFHKVLVVLGGIVNLAVRPDQVRILDKLMQIRVLAGHNI